MGTEARFIVVGGTHMAPPPALPCPDDGWPSGDWPPGGSVCSRCDQLGEGGAQGRQSVELRLAPRAVRLFHVATGRRWRRLAAGERSSAATS